MLQLGEYLQNRGMLSAEARRRAEQKAAADSTRLETAIIALGLVEEADLVPALAGFYRLPFIESSDIDTSPEAIALLPSGFANQHKVLPLEKNGGFIKIAVAPGFDPSLLEAIRMQTGLAVQPALCRSDRLLEAIRKNYGLGAEAIERMLDSDSLRFEIVHQDDPDAASQEIVDTAPVVRFVDQLLLEALKDRATDIHIEPFENSVRIRTRIDGMMHELPSPPGIKRLHPAIVSRIKIMAEMDIAERRLPQDGRIKLRIAGEEVDTRISTIPTTFGESVEIRLLPRSMMLMGLNELGISERDLTLFRDIIRHPNGIVLVTGPTGSGKTTTLYSALNEINSVEKKIITIEDPVEYQLHGINQIQVKPGIGLSFANGLRSILRHDPDIIMVGEIRDMETAEIAIRSALTGHLVFSTLHTNDAAGAITRLLDMGIEPYLVASSVRAVVAQRLIRKLCPACRQPVEYDSATLRKAGIETRHRSAQLWKAAGCDECRGQGYRGRSGIFEILEIDEPVAKMILDRVSTESIRHRAIESGMTTLRDDGWARAMEGETTLEEILRVTKEN